MCAITSSKKVGQRYDSTKTRHFIDMSFGPVHKIIPGVEENDLFRHYDPANHDLHFGARRSISIDS
jgi:hypothetical protein